MAVRRLMIAQGGGPTVVINASLAGAVIAARDTLGAEAVFGARNGTRGIVEDRLVDLTALPRDRLEQIGRTASAALGSARDKPDAEGCRRILAALQARRIDGLLMIGGNDTSATLDVISRAARAEGYPLACVHVPKTIDNDLLHSDHTPGYPSAALFVANAFAGLDLDLKAMPGIHVGIVMGRTSGFLTAASTLWRQGTDDGPHLVYLPERPFDIDAFVDEVRDVHGRLGRCLVAVAEGIHDAEGHAIGETLLEQAGTIERDDHGNVQLTSGALGEALLSLLRSRTGVSRVRVDTFGFLQRVYVGTVSPVDQAEARAVGERAALQAADGDGSVTIRRADASGYAVDYPVVPLDAVAGKTRLVPDAFIAGNGTDMTPAFADYLRPLVGAWAPSLGSLDGC